MKSFPTKRDNCEAQVRCTKSNPCAYCRNEWFGSYVRPLKLSDPADKAKFEEAKKQLNPRKH